MPFIYIEEGVRQGAFREDLEMKQMQTIIKRCMRANMYDWLIHNDVFDLVDEMDTFTAILLNGIKIIK